ncbi:MAG: mercuric reductase [Rhodothermales bacterium]|nr:mercuric reductase [Rhodothermales bacterium]
MNTAFPVGPHDERLVSLVHPSDWVNPKPADRYNLVVIGGGTAGLVSAMGAAGLGARVALVEANLLGGDCLNTGCVPSKALIAAASRAAGVRRGSGWVSDAGDGSTADAPRDPAAGAPADPASDFPAVMERMREIRASIAPHDSAQRLRDAGVDVFLGRGQFAGPNVLEVTASEAAGPARLHFAKAVICTGARPVIPPVDGLSPEHCLTSESVFDLTTCPGTLAVIGAGPIGCELAQSFQRLGSQVTVVSLDDQVLPREDLEVAKFVGGQLRDDGVDLRLGCRLESASHSSDGWSLRIEGAQPGHLSFDHVLVATGRTPNVEGLGLDRAGVEFGPDGIEVDDFLRTANGDIYAAGDVVGTWQFTHAADAMARLVIQNALFFGRKRLGSLTMSWCTYTDPEVAHVGLTPHEASASGTAVRISEIPMDRMDRARTDGDTRGLARLITDASSGRILGATVVAPHAGDLIATAALAISQGAAATDLASLILPYPTRGEVWKRFGDEANRERLKPWVKASLERVLRWRR